jgi:hypothetical protein
MGMDQKVTFSPDRVPFWPQLRALLSARFFGPQLRMIDGELAFPDEEPVLAWQELRLGTPSGMVTLRREPDGIRLVTWGNADDALRRDWNALTWVVAVLSNGTVEGASGRMSADEFARFAELEG